MCTGMELIPLLASGAMSAAGSLYNHKIEQSAIDETNRQRKIAMQIERKARNDEVRRQAEMEAKQFETFYDAADTANPESIAAQISTGGPAFDASADRFAVPKLQGQSTSGQVSEGIGKTIGDAIGETKKILGAKERLSAQDSAYSDAKDAVGRMGQNIQTVNSDRRRSSQVAQMETTIPEATVTKSSSPFGDILMLAGKLVGAAGGLGPTAASEIPLASLGMGGVGFAPGITPVASGWSNPFI